MTITTETQPETPRLTELTRTEVLHSLTGYEEQAIKARFGQPVGELLVESMSTFNRALAFTLYNRQTNGPKDSYKAAMTLTVKEVSEVFGVESEEDDDEEAVPGEGPVSEAGKDEPQLVRTPMSSPTSAS